MEKRNEDTGNEEWGQSRDSVPQWHVPTPEEEVVCPSYLRGAARLKWFEDDLRRAIGDEWIDHDGSAQLYVKRKRERAEPAAPMPSSNQGELNL